MEVKTNEAPFANPKNMLFFKDLDEKEEYFKKFSKKKDSIEGWEKLGSPICLIWVESVTLEEPVDGHEDEMDDMTYDVYIDVSYANIYLFKNGFPIASSKRFISYKKLVILDKDDFGVQKYIWM